MKNWKVVTLVMATAGIAQSAHAGQFQRAQARGVPDRYLVVLEAAPPGKAEGEPGEVRVAQAAEQLARSVGATQLAVYGQVGQFLVEATEAQAQRLARDPRVRLVEQDALIELSAIPSCYANVSTFPQANSYDPTSPQVLQCWDPQLSCADNWGLDRIGQRTGSQSAHTLDSRYHFTATGQGTHIYVLDTGIIRTHTEFALPGGGHRVGTGFNLVPGEASWNTDDDVGHGTHVASIAAGRRFGVAKAATLHPVRVFKNGNAQLSTVVSGVNWITGNVQRPAVVNMSFNYNKGLIDASALDSAVAYMVTHHGIAVVNAAGNWNQDITSFSPTAVSSVIVAGGLDWVNNQRWGAHPTTGCHANGCGSNWGPGVDVFAPATDVLAALGSGENTLACTLTGTSMAAPHVSGVVAQYLQANPLATPAKIEAAIIDNATPNAVTGSLGGSPNRLLYNGP